MKNTEINELKRPVIYGKIPLKLPHLRGDHMGYCPMVLAKNLEKYFRREEGVRKHSIY